MAGLDEMEEMIVRPMTRLDNRAALGVPGDAIGIARALGEDLEFAGAGMEPPHRTGKIVLSSILKHDVALVEDTVESIKPAIRTPGQ